MRGTLPRFRYDQLMGFGWKFLLPLAIPNIVVTSLWLAPTRQVVIVGLQSISGRDLLILLCLSGRTSDRSMYLVLFFIFGGLCVAGALNLLLQRHPINSALSLIVVMSSLAVLYLLLGAEFLAAAQVIVYSGAIMVLFTFVIMLLNAGEEERTHGSRAAYLVGFPGVAVLVGC